MAINAKWGAGKTTLGQMIKRRLESKPAADGSSPHVTCWFNAWMHDDSPSLATSLAAEVAQAANHSRAWWRRFFGPLPSSLSPAKSKSIRRGLLYLAFLTMIVAAYISVSLRLGYSLADIAKLDPRVIKSFTSLPGNAYAAVFIAFLVLLFQSATAILPVAKSVGEFVRDPGSTAKTASMQDVQRQLGRLIKQATPKGSKFVIFIDDLDRCRPPRSVDLLEVVNQLLNHPGVAVMLMADMQVVKRCAEIRYRSLMREGHDRAEAKSPMLSATYGWDYLQKVIQLQFDLPICPVDSIRRMISGLSKELPEEEQGSLLRAIWRGLTSKFQRLLSRVLRSPRLLLISLGFASAGILLILPLRRGWFIGRGPFVRSTLEFVASFILGITSSVMVGYCVERFNTFRRRRRIDNQIRARISAGERDFSQVEAAVKELNPVWRSDPVVEGLLRERLQRYLEDESELQREAEDEVMQHLEPLPRHAKRLLNRLRLLLFIAHERKIFGGEPTLSARHIGKWAVLCERWPELALVISRDPDVMKLLEDPTSHDGAVMNLTPHYRNDKTLQQFCLSDIETRLAPVMERIVQFRSTKS
jgi:hypothetical protein